MPDLRIVLIFTESKKPTRNPSFQGVQILSTPKGNRRKDLAVEKRPILGLDLERRHELDVIPPSSLPRAPLSVALPPSTRESEKILLCEATPVRPGTKIVSAIYGTPSHCQMNSPSRLSGIFLGAGSQNHGALPPSPFQARCSGKQQFLNIPVSFDQAIECTPSKVVAVHATPCKHGKLKLTEADASSNSLNMIIEGAGIEETGNTGNSGSQRDKDDSIYKSLGWDDYDELA
jgi:hypothetical protein